MRNQRGYFLILAVILILIMGSFASLIAYLLSNRANMSVAKLNGLRAFYIAESGLEIGARLLTNPSLTSRVACSGLTGTAAVTDATFGTGRLTLSTINSSPIFIVNSLNGAITASSTSITVNSTASFAPQGRILIDKEAIDYQGISGSSFIGLTRGAGGTLASSHTTGTNVGEYLCAIDSQSGIPTLTSPSYQRELQSGVQLQYGWAVGAVNGSNFVLTKWNQPTEESWTVLNLAGGTSAADLNGVSMLSNGDGWATGIEKNNQFLFLHWNGSSWVLNAVAGACGGQDLNGISMVSSRQGFAVGIREKPNCSSGNNRYSIIYYNGSTWTWLSPSTSPSLPADNNSNQTLNAVSVIDTNGDGLGDVGFAVGNNGQILGFNGTSWTIMTSPVTQNLFGVYTVSASEAWAIGASGVILRYNGSAWSSYTSPVTTQLNGISMLDTNGDGLADVGWIAANSQRILSYNGSSWSFTDLGGTNLLSVDIIGENDAWAVGASGLALHWDGSSWTTVSSGTTRALNSISLIRQKSNPNTGWIQVFR